MVSFENILSKITIQDVVLVILVILVIYLMFKSNSSNSNNENFYTATTNASDCDDTLIKNMTSLGNIASLIIQDDSTNGPSTLAIPSNNVTIPDKLTVTNLTANGTVKFTNKNSKIMEIFPRFMIIPWGSSTSIPSGWVLCDGETYNINSTQVQTPDLRDKFILSAGNNYSPFLSGGNESVTLTTDEMPWHTHQNPMYAWGSGDWNSGSDEVYIYTNSWIEPNYVSNTGGGQPHNNMPPYITLLYIMKL